MCLYVFLSVNVKAVFISTNTETRTLGPCGRVCIECVVFTAVVEGECSIKEITWGHAAQYYLWLCETQCMIFFNMFGIEIRHPRLHKAPRVH